MILDSFLKFRNYCWFTVCFLFIANLNPYSLKADGITPLQISLFSPFQLFDENTTVVGLRFNLFFGKVENMYGLDLGMVNAVEETSVGMTVGLVNMTEHDHLGFQIGVGNYTRTLYGFQFGVFNFSDHPYGIQIGAINMADECYLPMFGILVNWADRPYLGQVSIGFNQSTDVPFQISGVLNNSRKGFLQVTTGLNYNDDANLQLAGLSNYAGKGWLQFTPGINITESAILQFAGILNMAGKSPVQIAVLGNAIQNGSFQFAILGNGAIKTEMQIAGIGNYAVQSILQISGLININSECDKCQSGAQISTITNYAGKADFQLSTLNQADQANLQIGVLNLSQNIGKGQIGIVNRSIKTKGFMIGLANESHDLIGFQIGLVNIAKNAEFPIMLFFNYNYEEREVRRFTGLINRQWSPFQLSIYSPAQVFTYETEIRGLRFNVLSGKNRSVHGVDLGVYNYSSNAAGLELGCLNRVDNDFSGIQAGIYNITNNFYGMQIGLFGIYNRNYLNGFSIAPVAITNGDVKGMQVGLLVNYGKDILLPQISFGVNTAETVPGQIGLLGNISGGRVFGPQISGLFNYCESDLNKQSDHTITDVYGQFGGLFNIASGVVLPGQVSVFFNSCRFTPFQISAIGNQATDEANIQIAGIFNMVTREMRTAPFARGLDPYGQLSLFFNLSRGTYFQAAAFNIDQGRNYAQVGAINFSDIGHFQSGGVNICFQMSGTQVGAINFTDRGTGFQLGAVNVNGHYKGVTIGASNMCYQLDGLAIALFNYAERLNGIQIGVFNINKNGSVPIMIGANAGSYKYNNSKD